MSRKLDDLDPKFRVLAVELLARCVESGLQVKIITTKRTAAEQKILVEGGFSWTSNSKHLYGKAMDLVPLEVINKKNWDPSNPVWKKLGQLGSLAGLRWGIMLNGKRLDFGHFQEDLGE